MKTIMWALVISFASSLVHSQTIAVRSARVGATDVAKTAAFYQNVFGLQEILRVGQPELKEVIMNFGETAEEARANKATGVVVLKSAIPLNSKAVSPLIMNVEDIEGVVARVKENGGTVDTPPRSFPYGFTISMVRDPSGNRIELVKQEGGWQLPAQVGQ